MRHVRRGRIVMVALAAAVSALAALGPALPARAGGVDRVDEVSSLDRTAALRSLVTHGRTLVQRVPGGETVLTLDEPLQLRAVESGGSRVALATPLAPGADAYRPGGRTSTRLVVADLATGATRAYDVPRNVEPEAFGTGIGGHDRLFVVDHRPADDPSSYRVGAIDLASGAYAGLFGPNKVPLDIDMRGIARKQVLSASGDQLYTLYLEHGHDGGAHEGGDARTATGVAFVHVLDLAGAWAYCVDLPGVGRGPERASTIRLSVDGAELVVTDRHARKRITIPTADLTIGRLGSAPPDLTVTRVRPRQ